MLFIIIVVIGIVAAYLYGPTRFIIDSSNEENKHVSSHRERTAHCWNCKEKVTSQSHLKCTSCGWLTCECGSCGCDYTFNKKVVSSKPTTNYYNDNNYDPYSNDEPPEYDYRRESASVWDEYDEDGTPIEDISDNHY